MCVCMCVPLSLCNHSSMALSTVRHVLSFLLVPCLPHWQQDPSHVNAAKDLLEGRRSRLVKGTSIQVSKGNMTPTHSANLRCDLMILMQIRDGFWFCPWVIPFYE